MICPDIEPSGYNIGQEGSLYGLCTLKKMAQIIMYTVIDLRQK